MRHSLQDADAAEHHTRAQQHADQEPCSTAAKNSNQADNHSSDLKAREQQREELHCSMKHNHGHTAAAAAADCAGRSRQQRAAAAAANGQGVSKYYEGSSSENDELVNKPLNSVRQPTAPSTSRGEIHQRQQATAAAAVAAAAGVKRPARAAADEAGDEIDDTSSSSGNEEVSDADDHSEQLNQVDELGTRGRSVREGRVLRDRVKKPQLVQLNAEQQQRRSKKQQRRQQRKQEQAARRKQQQQQQELLRQQQHEAEVQAALRVAASGRLTRHSIKVIEHLDEPLLAAVARDSMSPGSTAAAADGTAAAVDGKAKAMTVKQEAADAEGDSTAALRAKGLRREALLLQQQLLLLEAREAAAASRGKRDTAAAAAVQRQRRSVHYRDESALDGDLLSEDVDEPDDDQDDEEDDDGEDDFRAPKGGRQLRRRQLTRQQRRNQRCRRDSRSAVDGQRNEDEEGAEEEEEEDEDDEDEDEGVVRKRYQLRSRQRQSIQRFSPRHSTGTGIKRTSGAGGRGSGERRRERGTAAAAGDGHKGRRGGGFAGGYSSSDDDDYLRRLRDCGHWGGLMAAGPLATPAPPNNTPATAAAAAAATGLLSPGRVFDRRGSFVLGDIVDHAAAGAAAAAGGGGGGSTGWGQWGAADGAGLLGKDAAAVARGKEGRGGLGQALITPLQVDSSIGFDQVGGLDQYLAALKEMIFLPLLYPELFDKFGINPPRGVLFHGPPGTGKTLVARALAAQASKAAGQKVSFYMRKGADLLSKWVGEAEKQLRLLFEEAARNQPAIIFFDEIDGLAPVRTSKQDQVHNSIVSTLLALMDGLEARGHVVLIGATNRPDALDPALRRPGRFDRELLFPLPDLEARRSILGIHSRPWQPQPDAALLDELATMTGGYCGADIKALCAEASLAALRRVYPQVYDSDAKLLINPAAVVVTRQDFMTAMQGLTPAAHRSTASHARPLNPIIAPCLAKQLQAALAQVKQLFPPAAACLAAAADKLAGTASKQRASAAVLSASGKSGCLVGFGSSSLFCMSRPRMLIAGPAGGGQQQLGAAVLAVLEGLPVHAIGLPNLLAASGSRSVEESLVSAFTEARRAAPSVLYWQQAHLWWAAAGTGLRNALIALLDDLPPDLPLLILATAELPDVTAIEVGELPAAGDGSSGMIPAVWSHQRRRLMAGSSSSSGMQEQQPSLEALGLDPSLAALFPPVGTLDELLQGLQQQQQCAVAGCSRLGHVVLGAVGAQERKDMLQPVLYAAAAQPAPEASPAHQPPPPALPPAPAATAAAEAARAAAKAAAAREAYERDQAVLRSLRITLRAIVTRAITQKRYRLFAEPPLPDEAGGFEALQALSCPMDLLTMLAKVDHQQYLTPAAFLADAHLIVRCAEELYGDTEAAAATTVQLPASTAAAHPAPAAGGGGADHSGSARVSSSGIPEAAAAAADNLADVAGASAAAAAAADGLPVVMKTLPAVRVVVSKEISRAMELKDELETQVYQLLSPDLVRACETIAAAGGPAPAPPGMLLPQYLMPPPYSRAAAGAGQGAAAGSAEGKAKATRSTSRLAGKQLDQRVVHGDPEALMRALKQKPPKPPAAAAALVVTAKESSKQQQQPDQSMVAEDAKLQGAADVDSAAAAAAPELQQQLPAAAAAADPSFGTAAADQICNTAMTAAVEPTAAAAEVFQQGSLHALKPVTNGQSRKRSAAGAAEGQRPGKAAATEQQQQQQQQLQQSQMHQLLTSPVVVRSSSPCTPADVVAEAIRAAASRTRSNTPPRTSEQCPQQQQQQAMPSGLGGATQGATARAAAAACGGGGGGGLVSGDSIAGAVSSPEHCDGDGVGADKAVAAAPRTADLATAEQLLQRLVSATAGMQLAALELLHARLSRVVAANSKERDRQCVLQQVGGVVATVEAEAAAAGRGAAD